MPGTDIEVRQDYSLSTDVIQLVTSDGSTWRSTMCTTLSMPASDRVGHSLVLTLMDSTVAPLAGVASEAWLRALFTTAVFQELSD